MKIGSDSWENSTVITLERLTQLTPATVTKSLSSRQDLTPVEVEPISDRFITIIDQLSQKIATIHHNRSGYFSS